MKESRFQYSVLRYRHSILLNEVFNVGLLFYFPEEEFIAFTYPHKLNRISHLYSNINIGTIKAVQSIFANKCSTLLNEWASLHNSLISDITPKKSFKEIINENFLVEDASALYFDEIRTGINIGINDIISYYEKEYFSCYEEIIINPNKKDEKYIEQQLKQTLKQQSFNFRDIETDKNITSGLISERFKYGWKNGGDKLITLIGFDLQEPETIKNKALSWYGKLSFLKDYAKETKTEFHLLTSKPSNRSLLKAYYDAISVIKQANAPAEIVPENELENYSKYITTHITGKIEPDERKQKENNSETTGD